MNVDSLKWIKISRSLKVTVTNSSELLAQKSVKPEPGGQGGHWPPQYLADQLTLFQLGEGRLSPPISTGPLNNFHLPASLHLIITFMNSQEILNTLSSINDRAAGIPRGREFQVKKKH